MVQSKPFPQSPGSAGGSQKDKRIGESSGAAGARKEVQVNEAQRMVLEFHERFEIATATRPTLPDGRTARLRTRLIQEEFEEFKEALEAKDLPAMAKELADLLYVVYGTAVSCGIDMEPVFREVHRSNMSKVGGCKREDGKWVKPPTYSPADIEPILNKQLACSAVEKSL